MKQTVVISDFDGTMTCDDVAIKILEYTIGKTLAHEFNYEMNEKHASISDYMTEVCQNMTPYYATDFLNTVIDTYNIKIDDNVYTLEQKCKKIIYNSLF